jgi:hypothetical protein
LWEHAKNDHAEKLLARKDDLEVFREEYAAASADK